MKNKTPQPLRVYAATCLLWLIGTFFSGPIVYGQAQALCLVEEILDGGTDAAGNMVNELRIGHSVIVSPDGKSVYAVGDDSAIVVFSRNPTTGS